MCGFAGFVAFGRQRLDAVARHRVLVAMSAALARRGPDDVQYYDDGALSLVFRRLSILDVAGGRQPFFNEAGDQILVANGEVYNHADLRRELQPRHCFASRSDCETLLHGFEEWGTGLFGRLRGMVALAHWDVRARVLTLARDRLGIKPLYVCRLRDGLLFGSELKALLAHPECPRDLDWSAVDRPLVAQPYESSYVRGVELLPGGDWLTVDAEGRERQASYWRLADHAASAPFGRDPAAYRDAYLELLESATAEHLQRDVGAGVFLSGGVDSALVAALVARHEKQLPCLTVVERGSYLEGDVDSARRLTAALGLRWLPVRFDHRHVVREMGFDLQRLEESVWVMDSPRFDIEWLFKEELHRVARRQAPDLKVVLLGQGADEFAGGYSRRATALRQDWAQYLRDEVGPNLVYEAAGRGEASASMWDLARVPQAPQGPSAYHRFMTLLTRQLQHHNLWHEDRTSAWNGLEARVPFLDHRLVELLASVPADLHEELFWNKRIVRSALERVAPRHRVTQPKLGFLEGRDSSSLDVIQHDLLNAVARDFRDKYLSGAEGPFDPARLQGLIGQALSRGPARMDAMRNALRCMAITIFERQLHHGCDAPPRDDRPVLRLMADADWQRWQGEMAAPPRCSRAWAAGERVALRPGVEIAASVASGEGGVLLLRDGVLAGRIEPAQGDGWMLTFLRHQGAPAARGFTLQDWLDEFEIDAARLQEFLDVLYHVGVLEVLAEQSTGADAAQPARPAPLEAGC